MEPLVRVVVVNYDGGDMTLSCLRHLVATEWPADRLELVLVDNGSHDDIVTPVRAEMPSVRVVESASNRGFAGGCNLGLHEREGTDYVALVNNDAMVSPGWLRPLVTALANDPQVGAACPKILFEGRFAEVTIESATHRRGRSDGRALGVRVGGATVGDVDVWPRVQLVTGFWGPEGDTGEQWTAARATLRVLTPDDGAEHECRLRVTADRPTRISLASTPRRNDRVAGPEPQWLAVPLGNPRDVINNVGTVLVDDGYAADRGYLEADRGQYDTPDDVFAWCGGAVLLRGAYLDDVGLFDERLFLYYEDVELSWRGAKRGWRYRYVPGSVVRHLHAATSIDGSTGKRYYDDRNHLLVAARHASAAEAIRNVVHYLLVTASYARRDILSPMLRGHRPRPAQLRERAAAFAGFLRLLPSMLRSRLLQ